MPLPCQSSGPQSALHCNNFGKLRQLCYRLQTTRFRRAQWRVRIGSDKREFSLTTKSRFESKSAMRRDLGLWVEELQRSSIRLQAEELLDWWDALFRVNPPFGELREIPYGVLYIDTAKICGAQFTRSM
jgi:hypothetical protein